MRDATYFRKMYLRIKKKVMLWLLDKLIDESIEIAVNTIREHSCKVRRIHIVFNPYARNRTYSLLLTHWYLTDAEHRPGRTYFILHRIKS